MKENFTKLVYSLTIITVILVFGITACCLAALGYNSKITMEKEKIEVDPQSNFNQNN